MVLVAHGFRRLQTLSTCSIWTITVDDDSLAATAEVIKTDHAQVENVEH